MQATPDLPTWRILPVSGNHFRWSYDGGGLDARRGEPQKTLIPREENPVLPRLPSMADLLLQASPKLLEGGGGGDGDVPMFRTASGRSVSVRQSSIQKAASVLGEAGTAEKGYLDLTQGGDGDGGMPMFRTGSGKSVTVRRSSIRKVVSVLEGNKTEGESSKLLLGGSSEIDAPMFQTGSGKSVIVKQSSIRKALCVLQEGENMESDQVPKHNVGVGCSFSNSLFQTGSGKTVSISSAGVRRATALLGLEETYNLPSSQSLAHAMDLVGSFTANGWENSPHLRRSCINPETADMYSIDSIDGRPVPRNSSTCPRYDLFSRNQSEKYVLPNLQGSEMLTSASVSPPIKFHTARGRSLSISNDSLQRAKSLLGDLELGAVENEGNTSYPIFSFPEETFDGSLWNKENTSLACLHRNAGRSKPMSKVPTVGSFSYSEHSSSPLEATISQGITPNQVNINAYASESIHKSDNKTSHMQNPSIKDPNATHKVVQNLRTIPEERTSGKPLVEISNNISAGIANHKHFTGEKKRLGRRNTISPFKRPRNSRFSTPLHSNIPFLAIGSSKLSTSKDCCHKTRVSTHYPFQLKRKSILDFFGQAPNHHNLSKHLSDEVRQMNADKAEKYKFETSSGLERIGAEDFRHMLIQSGASLPKVTKEWVANHYKWIVWKLACLERGYSAQASGNYLTVPNVLEELKYRYEREVNYGHRSAVKRILDGDASPASMVVLCISAIRSHSNSKICEVDDSTSQCEDTKKPRISIGAESSNVVKVELTDGWYSLDASLDVALSKHLVTGKLFVGQKLRIWGAGLCGWVGPVSSLEARKTVSLLLHINGTYRAHWADQLGFCKGFGAPLAFRCIKGAGGQVPRTLVGITRIYPILYKERFPDGGSIVRSERMENKMLQLYNQRRSHVAEGIMSEKQKDFSVNDNDSEEGAKIFKILETAAEPEVLMADMSSEQLITFSNYRTKQEAIRQSDMHKKIEKALEDAGLSSREVSPFMRVRVVGLTSKGSSKKAPPRQGLITIWNPTEKQKVDLVEGKIYSVAGLVPLSDGSDINIIYLQARGSTTIWKPLPPIAIEKFEPFFIPRRTVLLSNLGEVPLASEFDIAAVVLYVGDVYFCGHQKKQWIFMADGSQSGSEPQPEGSYVCLLAVSFCSPVADKDSSALVGSALSGSTVGFYNLIKRARDQMNHLWVAEATEISTYSFCHNLSVNSHLKEASNSADKWAKLFPLTIQKLRERVLCIVGGCGS